VYLYDSRPSQTEFDSSACEVTVRSHADAVSRNILQLHVYFMSSTVKITHLYF